LSDAEGAVYAHPTMAQAVEEEFMGGSKAKVWTFLILGVLLLIALLVGQAAWENPQDAKDALDGFMGLPGWALAGISMAVGSVVFYLGLKIETDWPEALGAAMIAGGVMAFEVMIGLDKFEFGGVSLLPYIIPLLIFGVLFGVGMVKSK
jgi:hypothetical protein